MIQDQYEEVYEVVYIQKGQVAVGYRLFNEIFYGARMTIQKGRRGNSTINDYSCLYKKCSEFLYKPIDIVEGFAIRIGNFNKAMSQANAQLIRTNIVSSYKYLIQEPLHEHRDEMARKFKNRIDYVNINAYGAGKVNIDKPSN